MIFYANNNCKKGGTPVILLRYHFVYCNGSIKQMCLNPTLPICNIRHIQIRLKNYKLLTITYGI